MSSASALTVRRFEFTEGNSNKFWEISVRGTDVMVLYGRIGTTGQVNVKSFPDGQTAAQHVERMVRAKIGKGYRAVA